MTDRNSSFLTGANPERTRLPPDYRQAHEWHPPTYPNDPAYQNDQGQSQNQGQGQNQGYAREQGYPREHGYPRDQGYPADQGYSQDRGYQQDQGYRSDQSNPNPDMWTPQRERERHLHSDPPPELTDFDRSLPALRYAAANRLNDMNWEHAKAAWARRRRDPIGPHVLVFLYGDQSPEDPSQYVLRIATRLFLSADEPDLARLLFQLGEVTEKHMVEGKDPRSPLITNWHDEMSSEAIYFGLGVSTLDTDRASWAQVQVDANSDMDLAGHCYITMRDGNKTTVHRRAINDFGDVTMVTTYPPGDISHMRRRWLYDPRLADPARLDPASRHIWDWLDNLHHIVLRGPSVR